MREPPFNSSLNDQAVRGALSAQAQPAAIAGAILIKNALNGGELSPEMLARHDLPRYQLGCESLLNMIPLPGGGLAKRPGMRMVSGTAQPDDACRLLPFCYSETLQFMLMLVANEGGGQVYKLSRDGDGGAEASAIIPYKKDELARVSFCQCGKVIYCAHENHPPAKLVYDGTNFTYEKITFGPSLAAPPAPSLSRKGEANPTANDIYYVVTAVDASGRESVASSPAQIRMSALTSMCQCVVTVADVPAAVEFRIYKRKGGEYGFIGRVKKRGASMGLDDPNFYDDGIAPDVLDQPPEEKVWFAGEGDYPSVVFLHQQRLGWASSRNDPLTLWLSQSSCFESMEAKKPPRDDDAIECTLASTRANRILWCVSDRAGLAIGTEGEEWYLTGAGGESAISPNSIGFQPQTAYGTRPGTQPVRANSSLLFVQSGGKIVRDMGYSFSADRYEAQDLTLLARHIFRHDEIADMAFQGAPWNILWIALVRGKLAGLTYMPEHEITAWHRHETNGKVRAVCTMADSHGKPQLWLIVDRPYGRFIEMLNSIDSHNGWTPWGEFPPFDDHTDLRNNPATALDGQAQDEFRARVIPCLPEIGMENGMSAMRVRKINSVKVRVMDAKPFRCRILSQGMKPGPELDVPIRKKQMPGSPLTPRDDGWAPVYDWDCPLGAGFREGSKLELILDGPERTTILSVAVSADIASLGGGQSGR